MRIKYRTGNDGLQDKVSAAAMLDCTGGHSPVIQSAKDDADINILMRRFGISGHIPRPGTVPQYGDFTGISDYQTALDQLREVDGTFASLPAEVRKRFANNPALLWEFVHDPDNREEARKLGLLEPEPRAPDPMLVRVVPGEPTEPSGSPPKAGGPGSGGDGVT